MLTTTELDRLRTDAIIAIHVGNGFDYQPYLKALEGTDITTSDTATMLGMGMTPTPEYRMTDLTKPMSVASMKIPEYNDFMAGHTKFTNSPVKDWMEATVDNQYGEHHPFGMKSNSCPLMHGAAHGQPAYCDHLSHMMPKLQEIASQERILNFNKDQYGDPKESLFDLQTRDRNQYRNSSDEDYQQGKMTEWNKELGMMPFLFGLEYNNGDQRDAFFNILSEMNKKQGPDSADSKVLQNKMQEKAGISWGRALRSWRERFTPMLHWWLRASDRHGPVSPVQSAMSVMKSDQGDHHIMSPWISTEMGSSASNNHHNWDIYMPWGGVGRDSQSLKDMMSQSFPHLFNDGWLGQTLIDDNEEMLKQYDHDGGSHFPAAVNHEMASMNPLSSSIKASLDDSGFFEQRRANWSHASNLHFLHPSEVKGKGGRMLIPNDEMMLSPLGLSLASQADMGAPRMGMFREEHPSSSKEYWDAHNALFAANDMHIGQAMKNMALQVMKQFGQGAINPEDPSDQEASMIARGNLQQIASAADYALKRMNMGESYRALAPEFTEIGDLNMNLKPMGPVHPDSHATSPPIYNNGTTHLWGHEMPTTLTWKYNPDQDGIEFGMAEEPFSIMQRTAHENHIKSVLPALLELPLAPKQRDIYALSAMNAEGKSPLESGSLLKAEDYEPTGVFKTKIIPAYTIQSLDEMDKLRGFSGDWVVQKMPDGERHFVEKKGNHLKNSNLSKEIKKDLRAIKGDFMFDGYVDDGVLHVVDLLIHKGTDLHMEPLEDRMNALRTLYDSTDNVQFPMPDRCVTTDQDGLHKTVLSLDDSELLIRDARSTFMKEKEVHPKWITYAKDSIAKQFYPPMPELMVYPNQIKLCYPSILDPVIVKGTFDGDGFDVTEFGGNESMIAKAMRDSPLWGPVAVSLLKEGMTSGAFTSSDAGSVQPLHSEPRRKKPRKLGIEKTMLLRAPAVVGDNEQGDDVADIMKHTRRAITSDDKAKTTEQLLDAVKGLNKKMLEMFSGEYGIERTEDGSKWTVNQAIDDDIIERMFPRMNRISPEGGGWGGMEADITAPRGPTELLDDSTTTFYDPKEGEQELEPEPMIHLKVSGGEGPESSLEVEGGRATLRVPLKTPQEIKDEEEAMPNDRSEAEDDY